MIGLCDRDRTCDLTLPKRVLYQLSYTQLCRSRVDGLGFHDGRIVHRKVPVFPRCQIACLSIVVSMGECRDLSVSPCRVHQATMVLTYTFRSCNRGKETLVDGGR